MSYAIRLTAACSMLHFLVDGLCACTLYLVYAQCILASELSSLHPSPSTLYLLQAFLTYNVLAFLTQPLTGLMADRLSRRNMMLVVAVVMLATAVMAAAVVTTTDAWRGTTGGMLVVASLLGIGNSLFHVWGGKQTATVTDNDIRALGVFVATGALGLCVGFLFFSWPLLIIMLLAIAFLALLCLSDSREREVSETPVAMPSGVTERPFGLALTALFIVIIMSAVMLRSFVGETFMAGISKQTAVVLTVGAVAMAGKMAGGWIVRCLGIVWALVLMGLAVGVCLMLRGNGMAMLLVGLFVVNCTMPITLYLANVLLPGREGLAFGLLAAALMPGYLMAML